MSSLVDAQVRAALLGTLQTLLNEWQTEPLDFEHVQDRVCYYTTRRAGLDPVTGRELHVVAAFLVSDVEQEAKDWYRALHDFPGEAGRSAPQSS